MKITSLPQPGYEQVVMAEEPGRGGSGSGGTGSGGTGSGWCAIIAVHDTTLGPAVGGLRIWNYKSRDDARFDVLRLARGMTYKSAVAHTGLGGGKAVLIGDAKTDKCDELFFWLGRFVESFGGRYVTAEDVGTSVLDLDLVARETRHVTGRAREVGGSGDPSPYTALGTFVSIQTCLTELFGKPDLRGRRVAIQGLGHVGYWLARQLAAAGAELLVADIVPERVERAVREFKAQAVTDAAIYTADCDVFAPCALGAVLNDDTIPKLKARIVCGAANNQLLDIQKHGTALMQRGILYAPDYVVNAGGILNISAELAPGGYDEKRAEEKVRGIAGSLQAVLDRARGSGIPTARAADEVAEEILRAAKQKRAAG